MYFGPCEAVVLVLVLVLVCDSAAKTDLDIYLGLDDGLWSMTCLDSRLYIYYCQGQVVPAEAQPPPLGSASAKGGAATTVTLEPGLQRHEL